jgi:tetratricopeptide (TPR) repeat protein
MFRIFVLLVGGLAWLWSATSQAQEPVLLQLYGKGVHEYFSGDYTKAFEQLTAAIAAGSHDPRVFYFRGLAYLKFGRTPEAKLDFQKGAELESRDVNKYYNVGRALERVQGSDRQLLESYRVQARMAAYEESEKIRKARYEALKREEARVLQQQAAEGAAPTGESTETIPAPTAEATGAEAPAETKANPAGAPGEEKMTIEKKAGAGPAPGAESATEDPFAAKAAEEKKPAAEEKPATETKPAGKSILGTLIKKAADAGSKVTAPKAGAAEKPAEPQTTADKPAENKEPQPADPFAK